MAENLYFFKLDSAMQTPTQIRTKITQLDVIIASLYDTALKSVATGNFVRYQIDTGQTKQDVEYSTTDSIIKAIQGYEKLRSMLVVKLQPRVVRLMDSKNFKF